MARIFISYAREDQEIAKELEHRLLLRKHEIFRDVHGIPGGAKWEEELIRKAKWCQVLAILVSPSAVESRWVFREFREAEKNGKAIIPIQINQTTLPYYLEDRNAIPLKYQDDGNNNLGDVVLKFEDALPQTGTNRNIRWLLAALAVLAIASAIGMGLMIAADNNPEPEATQQAMITEDTETLRPTAVSTDSAIQPSKPAPTSTAEATSTATLGSDIILAEDFEDSRQESWQLGWGNGTFSINDVNDNMVWRASGTRNMFVEIASEVRDYIIELRYYIADWGPNDSEFSFDIRLHPEAGNCKKYVIVMRRNASEGYSDIPCENSERLVSGSNENDEEQWHQLRIEVSGGNISWQIDDSEILSFEDAIGDGAFGITAWKMGEIYFDDIVIRTVEATDN